MVSAQAPGSQIMVEIRNPEGNKVEYFVKSCAETGPSGSSEGVIASTPEINNWKSGFISHSITRLLDQTVG